ncbi:hypothetical protein [Botrimarina mediterranea]|uniref:PEP-CTERM protein-sorting domain-containing protein n=1 Tax=Botrimarina mediterranea TaxID=2528022 RepID=A0A518K9W6_9BACT|nr:hypothetical protein [Botrimarina mediterranea]QDV74587.1 hypothetical protein Spa11_27930 [Botrimarina mediterranea]QDV79226.1 hypothetical protein K2D_28390 [Planctomycetes bacterium K2D]
MKQLLTLGAILLTVAVSPTHAALIGQPELIERSIPAPAGHVVNGMLINFDGQLFGQQLLVTLTQGAIFQDPTNPGDGPPIPDPFFPVNPSLSADTYVTLGAFASSPGSSSMLVVGGSTELGVSGPKQFDTEALNVAWAPAPGVVINGGAHFPIAQITLTNTAQGSWRLYSSSGGVGRIVSGGILNGRLYNVPEPVSLLLAGLGFAAVTVGQPRHRARL